MRRRYGFFRNSNWFWPAFPMHQVLGVAFAGTTSACQNCLSLPALVRKNASATGLKNRSAICTEQRSIHAIHRCTAHLTENPYGHSSPHYCTPATSLHRAPGVRRFAGTVLRGGTISNEQLGIIYRVHRSREVATGITAGIHAGYLDSDSARGRNRSYLRLTGNGSRTAGTRYFPNLSAVCTKTSRQTRSDRCEMFGEPPRHQLRREPYSGIFHRQPGSCAGGHAPHRLCPHGCEDARESASAGFHSSCYLRQEPVYSRQRN